MTDPLDVICHMLNSHKDVAGIKVTLALGIDELFFTWLKAELKEEQIKRLEVGIVVDSAVATVMDQPRTIYFGSLKGVR